MDYLIHILIMINIYLVLTVSTNLIVGMANLLSLSQAAFYGIGAYLTALALIGFNLPLIPTILFAMLGTAFFAFLIGYVVLRLEGDYFILATLGFQIIIYTILYNWLPITKGPYGIPGIPGPFLFGYFEITGNISFLILSTILSAAIGLVFYRLINSPFGRALKGMRDKPHSLQALGYDTTSLKIQAFVISSSFVALGGFIFASYVTYIDPTSFNLDEAIFILSAVLIGGTGNIKGPVLGAIFVIILPEALRFVGLPDNVAANMRMILYGFALIILMNFRTNGLAGQYKF